MGYHHRLFAGLLIVLYSLFAVSSLVAFGFEESATGSNSCTAQAADSGYVNLPPYSKDVTDSATTSTAQAAGSSDANVPPYMEHIVVDSQTDHANLPSSSNDMTDAGWWVGYPGTGEPDSGYANLPPYSKDSTFSSASRTTQAADTGDTDVPPYMEHVIVDTPVDGYANLPPYSKDSTFSSASTEVAEIYVPIGLAPAAYAAHTELFAVADDCAEVLAPVPTWISIQMEDGQASTSTVTATCGRCESTAF